MSITCHDFPKIVNGKHWIPEWPRVDEPVVLVSILNLSHPAALRLASQALISGQSQIKDPLFCHWQRTLNKNIMACTLLSVQMRCRDASTLRATVQELPQELIHCLFLSVFLPCLLAGAAQLRVRPGLPRNLLRGQRGRLSGPRLRQRRHLRGRGGQLHLSVPARLHRYDGCGHFML